MDSAEECIACFYVRTLYTVGKPVKIHKLIGYGSNANQLMDSKTFKLFPKTVEELKNFFLKFPEFFNIAEQMLITTTDLGIEKFVDRYVATHYNILDTSTIDFIKKILLDNSPMSLYPLEYILGNAILKPETMVHNFTKTTDIKMFLQRFPDTFVIKNKYVILTESENILNESIKYYCDKIKVYKPKGGISLRKLFNLRNIAPKNVQECIKTVTELEYCLEVAGVSLEGIKLDLPQDINKENSNSSSLFVKQPQNIPASPSKLKSQCNKSYVHNGRKLLSESRTISFENSVMHYDAPLIMNKDNSDSSSDIKSKNSPNSSKTMEIHSNKNHKGNEKTLSALELLGNKFDFPNINTEHSQCKQTSTNNRIAYSDLELMNVDLEFPESSNEMPQKRNKAKSDSSSKVVLKSIPIMASQSIKSQCKKIDTITGLSFFPCESNDFKLVLAEITNEMEQKMDRAKSDLSSKVEAKSIPSTPSKYIRSQCKKIDTINGLTYSPHELNDIEQKMDKKKSDSLSTYNEVPNDKPTNCKTTKNQCKKNKNTEKSLSAFELMGIKFDFPVINTDEQLKTNIYYYDQYDSSYSSNTISQTTLSNTAVGRNCANDDMSSANDLITYIINIEAVEYFSEQLWTAGVCRVMLIEQLYLLKYNASKEIQSVCGNNYVEFKEFLLQNPDAFIVTNENVLARRKISRKRWQPSQQIVSPSMSYMLANFFKSYIETDEPVNINDIFSEVGKWLFYIDNSFIFNDTYQLSNFLSMFPHIFYIDNDFVYNLLARDKSLPADKKKCKKKTKYNKKICVDLKIEVLDETIVVDDIDTCRIVCEDILKCEQCVALGCKGLNLGKDGRLSLIQIAKPNGVVYIFDILSLPDMIKDGLIKDILESVSIIKVVHDCKNDSANLFHEYYVRLNNVFDTRIAHSIILKRDDTQPSKPIGFNLLCNIYKGPVNIEKDEFNGVYKTDPGIWLTRPLTKDMIAYAALEVACLVPYVYDTMMEKLEDMDQNVIDASYKHSRSSY